MTISSLLRVLLIAALIAFTSRADATCLTTGTMPAEQHASDCSDMDGGSDHAPKPVKPGTLPCAFTCVALANAPDAPLPSPQPVVIGADATPSKVMAGASKRPPTPPPR